MPNTVLIVTGAPAPRILTIGDDDARLIVTALRITLAITAPTVADLERARDLIDLFTEE